MRIESVFIACVLTLALAGTASAQCPNGVCPLPPAGWSSWTFEQAPAPVEAIVVQPLEQRVKVRVKVVETRRAVRRLLPAANPIRLIDRVFVAPVAGFDGCVAGSCGR